MGDGDGREGDGREGDGRWSEVMLGGVYGVMLLRGGDIENPWLGRPSTIFRIRLVYDQFT